MHPAIVHLIGLPAAGKYTVAKALVAAAVDRGLPTVLVDNHATGNLVLAVLGEEVEPDRGVWDRVDQIREVVYRAIEDLSPPATSFVFTNVLRAGDPADEATVRRVAQLADARGAVYLPVRLTCDLDVLVDRVPNAERAARHKWTDPDAVRRFASTATIVDLAPHDPLHVDTTHTSPEACAAEILDRWWSLAT